MKTLIPILIGSLVVGCGKKQPVQRTTPKIESIKPEPNPVGPKALIEDPTMDEAIRGRILMDDIEGKSLEEQVKIINESELKGELTEDDLAKVTSMDLFGDGTDEMMKDVAKLKNLTSLDLQNAKITDAGMKQVAKLENLTSLNLGGTKITGSGLKELQGLEKLDVLYLHETSVTDAGLEKISKLNNLTKLWLQGNNQVTDLGMKEVAKLKNLNEIYLPPKITDVGLKELVVLKKLTVLDIIGTRVTKTGVDELQKALPKCKITHNAK